MEGLHILDFDDEHVARLGRFDFQWAGQVMRSGEVDVSHVVGTVVVLDLAASPIDALDFDSLAILHRGAERH